MIIVLDEAYRARAESRLPDHELRFFPPTLADPSALAALLSDADVLAFRRKLPLKLSRELLQPAQNLKYMHKSGSGLDWFDLDLISELGILLSVNTGFNAISVVEHAITLTLLASRRTLDYIDIVRDGKWAVSLPGEEPQMLHGKTVGIVGIGNIGSGYARAMQGLGATVIGHHPDRTRTMPDGVAWADLDTLLSSADVVSLHVPLHARTVGMIGAREIALMKPSAVLINTARGELVDEAALIAALEARRIRAAGLDVFEREPLDETSRLRTLPNVVATPHIAGVVREIAQLQNEGTVANVALFVDGKCPERIVNSEILKDGRARAAHLHIAA